MSTRTPPPPALSSDQPFRYDSEKFHPVVHLPPGYRVYDFSQGATSQGRPGEFGVGKYAEKRPALYSTALFGGVRNIHMGIDLSGPVGTPIHAFHEGEIFLTAYNGEPGDYGYTVITRHVIDGRELFALHGHLQKRSVENKIPGQKIRSGEIIAWIGDVHENGGWAETHLHFQLSWERPGVCDMPGAVSDEQFEEALRKYPDPRIVLGPLY